MDAQNNEIHMPHKSIFIKVFFKWRFAVAIATAILILFLFSCKKIVEDTQMDIAQQYFKNNILRLIIQLVQFNFTQRNLF